MVQLQMSSMLCLEFEIGVFSKIGSFSGEQLRQLHPMIPEHMKGDVAHGITGVLGDLKTDVQT